MGRAFEKIDANKDGRLERKEFENFLRQDAVAPKPEAAKLDKLKKG